MPRYLTADEAAAELGVTKNTLYAYVSRGLIRSEPDNTKRRTRRYRADDVRRYVEKKTLQENPENAAETALNYGLPVMESALTLIEDGHFYYRGHDACALARTHRLESVASILWDVAVPDAVGEVSSPVVDLELEDVHDAPDARRPPVEQLQVLLPGADTVDPHAFDLSAGGVARTGMQLLALFSYVLTRAASADAPAAASDAIHVQVGRAWGQEVPDACDLLRTALVLCADHGLNVSAFTARCVASAGATPYGAVSAALAAIQGRRHGGTTDRIDALFREAETPDRLRTTIVQRLQRGDSVPGFGHPVYPEGDPRTALLTEHLEALAPAADGTRFLTVAREIGRDLLGHAPTIDLALVALARALDLPRHAPLTLFALGRTVGWIGHIHEQYAQDRLIRPRARYVGPAPEKRF